MDLCKPCQRVLRHWRCFLCSQAHPIVAGAQQLPLPPSTTESPGRKHLKSQQQVQRQATIHEPRSRVMSLRGDRFKIDVKVWWRGTLCGQRTARFKCFSPSNMLLACEGEQRERYLSAAGGSGEADGVSCNHCADCGLRCSWKAHWRTPDRADLRRDRRSSATHHFARAVAATWSAATSRPDLPLAWSATHRQTRKLASPF
jgi:hypothetical protein